MTPKEFFYLVAQMREAQTTYFKTRDRLVFRAARKLENEVDREIARVRQIVNAPDDSEHDGENAPDDSKHDD